MSGHQKCCWFKLSIYRIWIWGYSQGPPRQNNDYSYILEKQCATSWEMRDRNNCVETWTDPFYLWWPLGVSFVMRIPPSTILLRQNSICYLEWRHRCVVMSKKRETLLRSIKSTSIFIFSKGSRDLLCNHELQYRRLIPASVDRTSASAYLYKHSWITCQK